ncbi:MAG: TM2 domain-containing protein [Acidobacteriota bacterium]
MPFCSQCGTKNADDARFCMSCGAPVAAAPSPQPPIAPAPPQSEAPPPTSAYPGGQYYQPPQAPPPAIPQYPPSQPPVGVPYAPPQAPQPYGPPPAQAPGAYPPGYYPAQPVSKRKSQGVAAALGFFLGGFGAQAFYNGQMKKGAIQLAVWWIASFVILRGAYTPMMDMFGQEQMVLTNPGIFSLWMLLGLVFAVACAFDGYKVAERVNRGEKVSDSVFF